MGLLSRDRAEFVEHDQRLLPRFDYVIGGGHGGLFNDRNSQEPPADGLIKTWKFATSSLSRERPELGRETVAIQGGSTP